MKSACVVLAWGSILMVVVAVAEMSQPARPAQANIRIASGTTEVTGTAVAAVFVTAPRPAARYVVQPGDTLSGIAARLGVRGGWPALYAANRRVIGPDPGLIRPGTVLVVPGRAPLARYTVAAGDTLSGVAAALGVRGGWPALYAANRRVIGPDPGLIRPGAVLVIPRPAAPRAPALGPGPRRLPRPLSALPGGGRRPLPGRTGAPAAAGMPRWLKAVLLAAGLVIGAVFLAAPVLAVRRRRRQAAGPAARPGGRLRAVPAGAERQPGPPGAPEAGLLAVPAGPAETQGQPGPSGVPAAGVPSLGAVRAGDPAGVRGALLEVLAVLWPAGARREMLHAAGQEGTLPGGGRRVTAALVDQAVEVLAGWPLADVSGDGQVVTARRDAAGAVREELARTGRLAAACRSVALVLKSRAEALAASPEGRAVRDIARQVAALDAAAGPVRQAGGQLAAVLLRLRFLAVYFLVEAGESGQAIAAGEPLAADLERLLGAGHPDTLNARNSLAAAYRAAGRLAEAIGLFEQTLVGRERALGPEHPDTLASQDNLAAAYQDAGRLAEAILLLKLTLGARERLLGAGHPSTLNSRVSLAAAYRAAGRSGEAIGLLEQALAGRERALGPGHPDTRAAREALEGAYREAGRPAGAVPPGGQPPAGPIVLADYERLVVTCSPRDGTVCVLRPPGQDPGEVLRAARLVLPEGSYQELAGQLGVPAGL